MTHGRMPALQGGLLAVLSAVLFGLTTPLLKQVGEGVGPFTTAAWLYLGGAAVALLGLRTAQREARLRRSDLPRIGAMAALGAVIAPVALAWGLQRSSATGASLLLTFEAVFTVVFAWWLYGESMDRRVRAAVALLTAGGVLLVVDQGRGAVSGWSPGLLAVALATVAWGLDNALSRGVADRDPARVVGVKAGLGAVATLVLAWTAGEPWPAAATALALLALGAAGVGLSLHLYLLAQRRIGAARTGSVFAFAPFVGAAAALAMGERAVSWGVAVAALLMLAGVVLHLAERHEHVHAHEAMAHEHAHTHDDGHHDHVHDSHDAHEPMPAGPHSHWHTHAPLRHSHPHTPDLHHRHRHASDRHDASP